MFPLPVGARLILLGLAAIPFIAGCDVPRTGDASGDRAADARACLAQFSAAYEGRTYAALRQKMGGRQDSQRIRLHGHTYEATATVSPDAEHRPDGIQIDFDLVDGDDPPTLTPLNKTFYLLPGEVLHLAGK